MRVLKTRCSNINNWMVVDFNLRAERKLKNLKDSLFYYIVLLLFIKSDKSKDIKGDKNKIFNFQRQPLSKGEQDT